MNLGKFKYLSDRFRNYMSISNTVMIGYLFLKESGWHWWYLLFVPVVLALFYFDVKYVLPSELGYIWEKNPAYKQLLKNTENNND